MSETAHERVVDSTKAMETAMYAALDAIDRYHGLITELLDEQEASAEPNVQLAKRYRQFLQRAEVMTTTMEDDVLDQLLFCLHRLFAVDLAEQDKFI